ncbi:MAG: L-arabinose ABC transporter permease AraH [Opitutia bacterium Tous-C1TDCM]|nr:MAG: L-arabinose ABC transporter permease AraH [Opitutae bacterium Tous-C1TDCM]
MSPSAPASPPARRFADFLDRAGMLVVLVLLFAACSLGVENFLSWRNLQGLALAVSMTGMVASTMLFCLAAGDFDLSVGAVVAAAGVVAAVVMNQTGSIAAGVAAALGFGTAVGLVNGWVVARLQINALIATLATMQIVRGFAYIVSDGKAVGIAPEGFFALGNSAFLGLPVPVWITLACFALGGLILNRTVFGRDTLAVGGNPEAAHLAGISVARVKLLIFTAQGAMAAFAGVVLASRMTSGQPGTSLGFELEVISACVLGGVSLTGGVGSMSYVVAGVLIMGIVQNAMNLKNIEPFWQYVARGGILLGAVLFDRWKRRR